MCLPCLCNVSVRRFYSRGVRDAGTAKKTAPSWVPTSPRDFSKLLHAFPRPVGHTHARVWSRGTRKGACRAYPMCLCGEFTREVCVMQERPKTGAQLGFPPRLAISKNCKTHYFLKTGTPTHASSQEVKENVPPVSVRGVCQEILLARCVAKNPRPRAACSRLATFRNYGTRFPDPWGTLTHAPGQEVKENVPAVPVRGVCREISLREVCSYQARQKNPASIFFFKHGTNQQQKWHMRRSRP